ILEASREANSSLVLDNVIQRVAEGMADAVGLPSCVIYLYDDEGDRLIPSAFVAREGSELDTARVSKVIPHTDSSQLLQRIFLARDIHDGMAQGLTAVSLQLEAAEGMLEIKPEKARAAIKRALELTRNNLEQARRSVLDLRASALQELTLTEALQRRLQQFGDERREEGISATFSGDEMYGRLSSRMELSLYRIFEAALENIEHHAGATAVD